MTYNLRDIALSVSLLVISAIWTWLVIDTIPTGWGHGDIGPRAFPTVLGIIMGSLAVLLLIRTLVLKRDATRTAGAGDVDAMDAESTSRWGLHGSCWDRDHRLRVSATKTSAS